MLGVCRDVLRNHHDAEDAAQATFLVLAKKGGSIRWVDSLASWLFGVALRVAAKSKAQSARRRSIERHGIEMKARTEELDLECLLAELHEELGRLPERYRAPIVLCHLEGLSSERVAGQLGLPVRTVQRRLAQARERLRARLVGRDMDCGFASIGSGIAMHWMPDLWLDSTVRAAAVLCEGKSVAVAASPAVARLTKGVLAAALADHLKILAASLAAAAFLAVVAGATSVVRARRPDAGNHGGSSDSSNGTEEPAGLGGTGLCGSEGSWLTMRPGKPVGGARIHGSGGKPAACRRCTRAGWDTFAIWVDQSPARYASLLATADRGARQGAYRFFDRFGVPQDPRTLARIVLKPALNVIVSVVDARGVAVEAALSRFARPGIGN